MKRTPALVLLLAVLLAAGAGCVPEDPGANRIVPKTQALPTAEATPGAAVDPVEQGRVLFAGKGICQACHGPEGAGSQIAPNLRDDAWLHFEAPATTEKIAAVILSGVQNPIAHPGVMPPRGGAALTDAEVEAVAAYVFSLSH